MMQKPKKRLKPWLIRYSYKSTQLEQYHEYQHDRIKMVYKNLVFWMKVASTLERLIFQLMLIKEVRSPLTRK